MKLLKVPFSAGGVGKTAGCEKAPEAIVKAMQDFYMNESGLTPNFQEVAIAVDNANISMSNDLITEAVESCDSFPILLGGDHSVTYAAFKGFAKNFQNPGLVVFDAHLDLMQDFKPPTHEDYLRALINDGIVDPKNVIIVGIRNMHRDELVYASEKKIRFFSMKQISRDDEVCDTVMEAARQFGALYISIDIDALDPAFAPGTGYIEPGGMTSRELISFLQRLKRLKNLQMADIVEVNPDKDINQLTAKLAAKLVTELFTP